MTPMPQAAIPHNIESYTLPAMSEWLARRVRLPRPAGAAA